MWRASGQRRIGARVMRLDVMYWEWSGNYLHSKWDGACSIEDECCVTLAKGGPENGLIPKRTRHVPHCSLRPRTIIYTEHDDCATHLEGLQTRGELAGGR
jgi:hypothetical protein